MTKMPPSYDIIIEENGIFKTIEVWAANKEGVVCQWRWMKVEIKGVIFNEKNYKDEPGLNLLWAISSTTRTRLLKHSKPGEDKPIRPNTPEGRKYSPEAAGKQKSIGMIQK